jgi:dihydrofolate synthase/folylpolyglutamate synthase
MSCPFIIVYQMDFRQAEQYLLSFTDYEKTPGILYTSANYDLRRMEKLLKPLGNPHLGPRTIHIAGTKGKGSTAAMIAAVLDAAGYRVGLFTSPHLHTIRERARVNNTMITEEEFASILTELEPVVEKIHREAAYGQLTTFEILTAAVFTYFRRNSVDLQVLEAGLGGRLDATNIVEPDICVITSISLDHTEVLGDTVKKIAIEKTGIIKPGCIVINHPQVKEAAEIIRETCKKQGAELLQLGEDITWERTGGDLSHQSLTVKTGCGEYEVTIPLLGDYQLENAAAAVAVIEALRGTGIHVIEEAIKRGLSRVNWPGRIQILSSTPMIVADGAHNRDSMKKLIEAVKENFTYHTCFVIFGTSCDKDIDGMATEILSLSDRVVVTSSSHPRSAAVSSLIEGFAGHGVRVDVANSVHDAISKVIAYTGGDDLILVTGSIFIVAEAIEETSAKSSNST